MNTSSNSLSDIPKGNLRTAVQTLVEAKWFGNTILAIILANALVLGLETSSTVMDSIGGFIVALDHVMLDIFIIELLLRIYAWRGKFFTDAWSLFDLAVIIIAVIPASGPFAVFRALRVLRVLRLLTIVPSMRRVVAALLGALPGLGSIALLLLLVYYVFAVIATKLFGPHFDEWFGTLGRSFYSLFQIMTLESWSMGIVRPIMQMFPYAWAFFVPFILMATFTMLNLFIAIIVNAMQSFNDEENAAKAMEANIATEQEHQLVHAELRAIREELVQLQQTIKQNG
jgi:voltage-gated sodium channel